VLLNLVPQQDIPIPTIHDNEEGGVQESLMLALVRSIRGNLGGESYYSKFDVGKVSLWHKRTR
jgi:hypothetical protein